MPWLPRSQRRSLTIETYTNRHLVEVPDSYAVARWARDADQQTIARCILATLKYEPHTQDISSLRRVLQTIAEMK